MSEITNENVPEPRFTIDAVKISISIADSNTHPKSLDDFADVGYYYVNHIIKKQITELIAEFTDKYAFMQFMQAMYSQALKAGTFIYYKDANGSVSAEFPVQVPNQNKRYVASFIPNTKPYAKTPFFFLGLRHWGKLYDFAKIHSNLDSGYRYLCTQSDVQKYGIYSEGRLKLHLENSFVQSVLDGGILKYEIEEEKFIEFALSDIRSNEGCIITARFSNTTDKWEFLNFCKRTAKQPLADGIRDDIVNSWKKKQREIQKKQESEKIPTKPLEIVDVEIVEDSVDIPLIPFDTFPIEFSEPINGDFLTLEQFAYINYQNMPYLYKPEEGVNLLDTTEILDSINEAFTRVNPYTDIDYYQDTESGVKSAELKLVPPNYPEHPIYAVFTENRKQNKQPWYLSSLVLGDKYQRLVHTGNYDHSLKNLQKLCDTEKQSINSPDDLKNVLSDGFRTALRNEMILVYGEGKRRRAEFFTGLKDGKGDDIYAVLRPATGTCSWRFISFTVHTGDNIKVQISQEYILQDTANEIEEETDIVSSDTLTSADTTIKTVDSFVGESIRGDNGSPLRLWTMFADVPSHTYMQQLADMAESETWEFNPKRKFVILYGYLNEQFIRLSYEKKIGYYHAPNQAEDFVVFHTGLFTRTFRDPIYACFRRKQMFSYNEKKSEWRLDGWCCESDGGKLYEKMKKYFPMPPENTDFLRDEQGEYLPLYHYKLDPRLPIDLKEEHVLKERGYRLPVEFLRKSFTYMKDKTALAYLQEMKNLNDEELVLKEFWLKTFLPYLEKNTKTYDHLLQQLLYVVEEGKRSNRPAIPMYYPVDNTLHWILPLQFSEKDAPKNLALVVGLKPSGGYKGMTVLPIEGLYHRARVVENPDRTWLSDEVLDKYYMDLFYEGDSEWLKQLWEQENNRYDEE